MTAPTPLYVEALPGQPLIITRDGQPVVAVLPGPDNHYYDPNGGEYASPVYYAAGLSSDIPPTEHTLRRTRYLGQGGGSSAIAIPLGADREVVGAIVAARSDWRPSPVQDEAGAETCGRRDVGDC